MRKEEEQDWWPELDFDRDAPTVEHLHRLAELIGKHTLFLPFERNWGSISLIVTARGFATPTIWTGDVSFEMRLDILDDQLAIVTSTGRAAIDLVSGSIADFYSRFQSAAQSLGIAPLRTSIEPELPGNPHFESDVEVRPYDGSAARRVWAAFASAARALTAYQSSYRGHRPRVGVMWGGFDLFAPRYGQTLAELPAEKSVFMRNGMMDSVVAVGFSLGDAHSKHAGFYAYLSPGSAAFAFADLAGGKFDSVSGLAILPWDIVRINTDPLGCVVAFADAVYGFAANELKWPKDGERHDGWYATKHLIPSTT